MNGPIAVALGAFDQDHQVLPSVGREGASIVVLHHATFCPEHRHGILARTLTVFAKKDSMSDADHVLAIPGLERCIQMERSDFRGLGLANMTVVADLSREALRENRSAPFVAHSPPDEHSPLRFLRSAQLLI